MDLIGPASPSPRIFLPGTLHTFPAWRRGTIKDASRHRDLFSPSLPSPARIHPHIQRGLRARVRVFQKHCTPSYAAAQPLSLPKLLRPTTAATAAVPRLSHNRRSSSQPAAILYPPPIPLPPAGAVEPTQLSHPIHSPSSPRHYHQHTAASSTTHSPPSSASDAKCRQIVVKLLLSLHSRHPAPLLSPTAPGATTSACPSSTHQPHSPRPTTPTRAAEFLLPPPAP